MQNSNIKIIGAYLCEEKEDKNDILFISKKEALESAHLLFKMEGLLVGFLSGTAIAAFIKLVKTSFFAPDINCLIILSDGSL